MKFKNKKTGTIVDPHEEWLIEKIKKDSKYTAVSEKKDTASSDVKNNDKK